MPNGVNNRSQTYIVARAMQRCANCGELTAVIGIFLPAGHETLEIDSEAEEDTTAAETWEVVEAGAGVFYVEHLPQAVQLRLRQLSQHYYVGVGDVAGRSYWLNHCSLCAASQGDFELYCEPEGAFMPMSEETACSIELHEVLEPFGAQAVGYIYAPELLDYARR